MATRVSTYCRPLPLFKRTPFSSGQAFFSPRLPWTTTVNSDNRREYNMVFVHFLFFLLFYRLPNQLYLNAVQKLYEAWITFSPINQLLSLTYYRKLCTFSEFRIKIHAGKKIITNSKLINTKNLHCGLIEQNDMISKK